MTEIEYKMLYEDVDKFNELAREIEDKKREYEKMLSRIKITLKDLFPDVGEEVVFASIDYPFCQIIFSDNFTITDKQLEKIPFRWGIIMACSEGLTLRIDLRQRKRGFELVSKENYNDNEDPKNN